jgi:hypothetical protein
VAPAGAAAPSFKVTPFRQLVEGQSVQVKGKNYAPDANLVVVECKAGSPSADLCDQSTAVLQQAGSNGKFTVAVLVQHLLSTTSGPADCSSDSCVINVGVADNFAATASSVDISFAHPAKTPTKGAITVPWSTPAGGTALVSATGFAANAKLSLALCTVAPASPADCTTPVAFYANSAGAGSASIVAPSTISTANTPSTDCTVFNSCEFGVWDVRSFFPTVARAFDVVAPTEPGTLTVSQTSGLHDGDTVTVSGTNWDAGKIVRIYECNGTSSSSNCNNLVKVTPGDGGTFVQSYSVKSVMSTGQAVNCLTGPCYIVLLRGISDIPIWAAQKITFA